MGEYRDFYVGARVAAAVNHPAGSRHIMEGMTGTVTLVYDNVSVNPIGVCWDAYVDGHDLNDTCKHGYGWFCRPGELTIIPPVEEEPITIDPDFWEILNI